MRLQTRPPHECYMMDELNCFLIGAYLSTPQSFCLMTLNNRCNHYRQLQNNS